MLVNEYINECKQRIRQQLTMFRKDFGADATNTYAAFRWGYARKNAKNPEEDFMLLFEKIPDYFFSIKKIIDEKVDEFIDIYGAGLTEDIVKETWGLVPGNPNVYSKQESFDGSDKVAESSPGILYHLENLGTDYGQELRAAVLANASDEARAYFGELDYDPIRIQDGSKLSYKMWHELRYYSLGASDLSSLTGFSPFNNALGVWNKKLRHPETAQSGDDQKERIFDWGHNAEQYLRKVVLTYPEFGGCRVLIEPMLFGFEKAPFMTCNLDAILAWPDGHYSLLEFKAPSPYKKSEYENNSVPAYYYDQIQGQMMNLNVDDAFLVALFDRDTITVSHVYRDLDYELNLVKVGTDFWECVQSQTPPSLNGSGSVIIDIMNRYYGKVDRKAAEMKLDEARFAQLLDEANYYSEQQKLLTKEADKAKDAYTEIIAQVIAEMGSSTLAVCTDTMNGCVYKCKYSETAGSPTMNKASILLVKNEAPDLYKRLEPYISQRGGGRRFTLRKVQKE